MKKELFDELLVELGKCEKCLYLKKKTGKDCSLLNTYIKQPTKENWKHLIEQE